MSTSNCGVYFFFIGISVHILWSNVSDILNISNIKHNTQKQNPSNNILLNYKKKAKKLIYIYMYDINTFYISPSVLIAYA